ncbi:MAG: FAD-binding protein, partial [Vicinamibacterales bacterium]
MNPARCDERFIGELRRIAGEGGVFSEPLELLTYECDALTHLRAVPAAVVLPSSPAEVQAIVRLCARDTVPFVARGHGTGLSGGALPVAGGIVIALSRLNRVLNVDIPNRRVTAEPGVTNLEITRQVAPFGYYYAPDPSSQQVCSIGGNVAENSGGAHCLKYGFTVHHVLEVEAVLPDGELVRLGGSPVDTPGPDLLGLLVGSEGTLAVVTSVTVRILRKPESVQTLLAAFDTIDAGGAAVSDIIGAGILPAAIEMMDALAIQAAEAAVQPGFPPADTVLIVELDGPAAEVRALVDVVEAVCSRNGATTIEVARTEEQRARIWKGRKAAFAAMGRVSPNYYVQDGVVPRTRLPEVLSRIRGLESSSGLRIGNVFHAGDGNLHPLIC